MSAKYSMERKNDSMNYEDEKAPMKSSPEGASTSTVARASSFFPKNPSVEADPAIIKKRKRQQDGRKEKSSVQRSLWQYFVSNSTEPKDVRNVAEIDLKPKATYKESRNSQTILLRDVLSVASQTGVPSQHLNLLNQEQRIAATCPPDIPLSIRAGAGSGKTHTMVQRALHLVNHYKFNPEEILMITFSKKAANELKERITSVFSSLDPSKDQIILPTVKTFHGLAYTWVHRYWKECGLGKHPSILATKSQQKKLMALAIEKHLESLRLQRCKRMLLGASEQEDDITWNDVFTSFKEKDEKGYNKAYSLAAEKAREDMPDVSKLKPEERNAVKKEMKVSTLYNLRAQCYLAILRTKKRSRDGKVDCDLERRWSGDAIQCSMYLTMIERARLGNHTKNEYPKEDTDVWEMYERLQREMGQLTFDTVLDVFTENILGNETLSEHFHAMYLHVIVDEFQDDSIAQATMLHNIVKDGSLTVVGDDDQCIYSFRGASPGNFDRLRDFYSSERQMDVSERTLVQNHRSSANILAVAAAFLEGDTIRHRKDLKPTKSEGIPVEVWDMAKCEDQAKHIAITMVERHEQDGVPYGEMACLFRCIKTKFGNLTKQIQVELAQRNVPFHIVGGKTLFEKETVVNLLSYLHVCLGERSEDESFESILNKPPRRLPNEKIIPLIKEQVERSSMDSTVVSFQEAAAQLCKTGYGLSSSQRKALNDFMDKISCLSKGVNSNSLPDFLRYLWTNSGLEKFYRKRNKESDDEQDDDEQEDEHYVPYVPLEIGTLFELAQNHYDEWGQREYQILQHIRGPNGGESGAVPSLVELSRKCVKQNLQSMDVDNLPEYILDELVLAPYALGRSVIREFLASAAFELSEEVDPVVDMKNKVSIGTIHRSKGLEWRDVYVPYLNHGYLPTKYRADDEDHDEDGADEDKRTPFKRHVRGCIGHEGGGCDKECSQHFRKLDDERLGGTAEERHLNEERRLAHVASTRAQDKLVFTSFQHGQSQSEFRKGLQKLPESVVRFVNKDRSI